MADDLSSSHHLAGTEYPGTFRSVHLDPYVPYQTRLGANLQLRVEQLDAQAEAPNGYRVLTAPRTPPPSSPRSCTYLGAKTATMCCGYSKTRRRFLLLP